MWNSGIQQYQQPAYGQGSGNPNFDRDGMEGLTNRFGNMDFEENQQMHDVNTLSRNQPRDPLGARNDSGQGFFSNQQGWHQSANSHPMGDGIHPSAHAGWGDQAPIQGQYQNQSGLNSDADWNRQDQSNANYGNVHPSRQGNFPAGANFAQQQSNFGHQQSNFNDGVGGLASSFGAMGFGGGRKRKKRRRKKTHKKKHKTTHKKRHKKTRAKKKHKKRKHKKKTRK